MFTAFALLSTVLLQSADAPPTLELYTEHNPPFTYKQEETGEIGGATMAVVRELMQRADVPYSVELIPWKRAYSQTLRQKNACVFGMNRTPEREKKFLWVSPLFEGPWSFFKRPDAAIELTSLADVAAYKVVATSGYASALALQQTGHEKILLATSNERAMQLLFHGRVDLMMIGDFEAPYVAKTAGLPTPTNAMQFMEAFTGMGCNLDTDPSIIAKLQAANAGMADFRKKTYSNVGN